jgi:hypothetical protein
MKITFAEFISSDKKKGGINSLASEETQVAEAGIVPL